jgi:hypothetical protein
MLLLRNSRGPGETEYRATVTAFQWANPHAGFQATVESPDGTRTLYNFELPAPYGLEKISWTQDTMHAGDVIVITAYPAKDKSAHTRTITESA